MKRTAVFAAALLATLAFDVAYACGESLYRVGRGVAYRTYTAPLPGNLLVYAGDNEGRRLAAELAASGHVVDLVLTDEQLADALGNHEYDIVIAPFARRDAVSTLVRASEVLLPVVADREEERQASLDFERVLAADGNIKQYLKVVHMTLKAKA